MSLGKNLNCQSRGVLPVTWVGPSALVTPPDPTLEDVPPLRVTEAEASVTTQVLPAASTAIPGRGPSVPVTPGGAGLS